MSGSLIRVLVRFWADGKLTDWRPSDTETGTRGFPLQILSLPLLCSSPPEAPTTLSLSGVCFSKNSSPSFRIHLYNPPHTATCVYHEGLEEGGWRWWRRRREEDRGKTSTATAGCTSKHACQPLLVFTEQHTVRYFFITTKHALTPDRAHCLALSAAKVTGGRS